MSVEYEREHAGEGQMVMPFYLICDVSLSMSDDMAALNDGIQRLRRSIVAEPLVDDVAHIGIMTFSDTAKMVVPLTQLSEQPVPLLRAEGATDYGAAFRELARVIPADFAALRAQGYRVFRPCAFFLTDGEPLDDDWWETFKATLTYNRISGTGMRNHPVFIPFGFGEAPVDVLQCLAYPPERGKWYHIKSDDIGQVIKLILDVIMKTVVASGQSSSTGQPALVHTEAPTMANATVTQGVASDWLE
ncbi:MAG TPA: VWA domain-containing protein [Trebonia sp.]|nr:VWA domain-containing protein [Trebonia sp.]